MIQLNSVLVFKISKYVRIDNGKKYTKTTLCLPGLWRTGQSLDRNSYQHHHNYSNIFTSETRYA